MIDMDIVRSRQESNLFCKMVPKGGMLHVHPFGTLDRPTPETPIFCPILKFEDFEINKTSWQAIH